MRKVIGITILAITLGFGSWIVAAKKSYYGNLSFTVWKLEKGPEEILQIIGAEISKVIRDSWIHTMFSLDVSDGNPHTKILERDGFRFILTMRYKNRLDIQIFEKDKEKFIFHHKRSSTARYIFYDEESKGYLIEAVFTGGDNRIGLIGPGISIK